MGKTKEEILIENKILKEMIQNQKNKETKKIPSAKEKLEGTIKTKIAVVESHTNITKAKHAGLAGMIGCVITVLVSMISTNIGAILGLLAMAVSAFFYITSKNKAQYYEQKYGIVPQPIIQMPQQQQNNQELKFQF